MEEQEKIDIHNELEKIKSLYKNGSINLYNNDALLRKIEVLRNSGKISKDDIRKMEELQEAIKNVKNKKTNDNITTSEKIAAGGALGAVAGAGTFVANNALGWFSVSDAVTTATEAVVTSPGFYTPGISTTTNGITTFAPGIFTPPVIEPASIVTTMVPNVLASTALSIFVAIAVAILIAIIVYGVISYLDMKNDEKNKEKNKEVGIGEVQELQKIIGEEREIFPPMKEKNTSLINTSLVGDNESRGKAINKDTQGCFNYNF